MKEELLTILRNAIGEDAPIELSVPEEPVFGHFSTNVAMRLAKKLGRRPIELAEEIVIRAGELAPEGFLEKVEAASPGFVNFWMSKRTIHEEFEKIAGDKKFGTDESMEGKTVMVEFTDPNPFKLFHIGHLMSNTIGESFARLHEASGAKVIRANYQGDVGLHIAKAVWGMQNGEPISQEKDPQEKMQYLGAAYALGSHSYDENSEAKKAITVINEKIYPRKDEEVNKLYDVGRKWSLAYFETMYERLGTKFDHYFFESEVQSEGLALVLSRMDVFAESEGAIVFPGEQYGLHTRVFINSKGLPTYEAKELGLNKKKFELYNPDTSIIVTGNEIVDYFRVLLKAMALTLPNIAERTHHVPHGMLRLPSGKMSSRTGDVITAESLIDDAKAKLMEHVSEKSDLSSSEREEVTEAIAIGAIKYSILKQNPGQDIIFDLEKSLSVEGDSGPYVQYAYARLKSILRKAGEFSIFNFQFSKLDSDVELSLMRKISEFPDVVAHARERYAPSALIAYLYKLASLANRFYETMPILKDENEERKNARLALTETAARTIAKGLELLGIKSPEKI